MRAVALILAALLSLATPAWAGKVALTFDDLPYAGRSPAIADAEDSTTALLAGLRRHHLPAIGFVNEVQLAMPDRARRIGLLTHWLDAGDDLGNHGYSHRSLTTTPPAAYIADIARGQQVTAALLAERGRRERWFRHPYLETGPTLAARSEVEGWLRDHRYRVAPVTMENSDWQFAPAYEAAKLAGDAAAAERLRTTYLDFTDRTVGWYQQASRALFGREIAFVFLLHASRLNADSVDALAAILARHHLQAETLAQAVTDPSYRTPDTYAGPDGMEWLSRWSLTTKRTLPWAGLPKVPDAIVAASNAAEARPIAR